MNEQELTETINGCKLNDEKSQTNLYEEYKGLVTSIVSKYYKDKHTVDDIVQEVFIKIFASIHMFKNEGSFKGWVCRVVRNFSVDKIRNVKHTVEYCDEYHEETYDDDYLEREIKEERVNDIISELDNLSVMYGLVFRMYYIEGMPHKEIAEELNINIGTSKSNLHKAKKNIQNRLKNKNYE